jgi:hypothetical protein
MPAEEKPAEGAAATDDAAATTGDDKPAGKEKPAKPETSGPQVGPRDGVQYTPADIDRSLAELAAASEALDSAPKADAKKFKGQFYRKLYQLAEVATFTPSMVASPQAQQGSQQEVVYHALTGSTATPTKFAEVGKAAAIWLSAIKGKEHQGIVLSGTVQRISHRGKVFETEILLTDNEHVVTVLSPTAPPMGHRDAAVVWGSIVDDPAKKIAGYPGGTAEVVVWATTVEPAPAGAVGTRKAAALPKQER